MNSASNYLGASLALVLLSSRGGVSKPLSRTRLYSRSVSTVHFPAMESIETSSVREEVKSSILSSAALRLNYNNINVS